MAKRTPKSDLKRFSGIGEPDVWDPTIKKYSTGDPHLLDQLQHFTVVGYLSDIHFLRVFDGQLQSAAAGLEKKYGSNKKWAIAFAVPPLTEAQNRGNDSARSGHTTGLGGSTVTFMGSMGDVYYGGDPFRRHAFELFLEMNNGFLALTHYDPGMHKQYPVFDSWFGDISVQEMRLNPAHLVELYSGASGEGSRITEKANKKEKHKILAIKTDTLEIFTSYAPVSTARKKLEKSYKGNSRVFQNVKYPLHTGHRQERFEGDGYPIVEFYLVDESKQTGGLVSADTGKALEAPSSVFKESGGLTGGGGVFKQPVGAGSGGGSIFK